MDNTYSTRNCNDEAIVKVIGRLTLNFEMFEDFSEQIKLKEVLEQALYGYDIITQSKELITSDILEKAQIYIAVRKLEGLSSRTLTNYKGILIKFADYFHKPLSSITSMDIRMWLAMYKNSGCQASTINEKIFVLSTFFTWLCNEEVIFKNPMKQVKITKVSKRLKQIATDEEIEMLKDNCKTLREKCLLSFSLDTGCRVSEISNCKISDCNFKDLSCMVIGKGDKQRIVYFTVKTKRLLEKYIKERKEFDNHIPLFLSDKFPYDAIKSRAMQLIFSNIKHRANLDDKTYITMHGCRRWLGSHLINKNIPMESIRQILGHENSSTTQLYAQSSQYTISHDYRVGI